MNVGEVLRSRALREPQRIALYDIDANVAVRLDALDAAACRVAAALDAAGVREGDRVAIAAMSSVPLVAAMFGALYAGAVAVPVSLAEAPLALAARLVRTRCRHALVDVAGRALVARAMAARDAAPQVDADGDAALRTLTLLDAEQISADGDGAVTDGPRALTPVAPALVLATSGTTGTAKGAVIAHASLLLHSALLVSNALQLRADDRVLAVLPLAHSYGFRIALLAPLIAGAEIVLVRRFDAARTLAVLADWRITFAPVVPTMLAAWADVPRDAAADLSALRFVLSAGAPLPDELALRAEARLGCAVRQGYGMTEATFSAVDAPPGERVLGSVGRAVLGVEIRAVDEAGVMLPTGATGELAVRGHHTMLGYDDDAGATRAMRLPGGFLRSGDLGRVDVDGRVWVTDRKKDLIIRGGMNVAPSQVESALASHPDVAEVAVIGRDDPRYGEVIVAIVRLRAGASPAPDALLAHAALRLARHELPRQLAFVDALPVGHSGKVDRRGLRAAVASGALVPVTLSVPAE